MTVVRLLPVILSALLLGAHFFRAGLTPVAYMMALFPALLLLRRAWVARLTQLVLTIGAIEWLRTLVVFVTQRRELGQSWTRLAVILGVVAAFTLGSALLFSLSRALQKRYRLDSKH